MEIAKIFGLFVATAVAEIMGYLPYLWLKQNGSVKPSTTDLVGVAVCLLGTAIIMLGSKAV